MKILVKKISCFVLFVVVVSSAIVYACPMLVGDSMTMIAPANTCESVNPLSTQDGCVDSHLATIAKFLSDIPQVINFLLSLVLLIVIYQLFSRKVLVAMIRPLFNRLKHRYLYYYSSIILLIEKRLLRYLGFLGNQMVVSF